MKFICLGYFDEQAWNAMSEAEQKTLMNKCLDYDDVLRKGGHFVGGEALQSAAGAITLWCRNGKIVATDGPYAETKEQLGGILILEANDLNHVISLMSQHPGVRCGPFEIRAADETINDMIAQRDRAVRVEAGGCKTF
jgi:hypothetical protein